MMISEPTKYKITLFGELYTIISDEKESDIIATAQELDTLMKELAQKSPGIETHRIAVLAAFNFALKTAQLKRNAAYQHAYHEELVNIITRELPL